MAFDPAPTPLASAPSGSATAHWTAPDLRGDGPTARQGTEAPLAEEARCSRWPSTLTFELVFSPRTDPGRPAGPGLCFPCNAAGQVDLDGLSEAQRNRYLYARAVMGRALDWPTVRGTCH